MSLASSVTTPRSSKSVAWPAIISGVFGLLACGFILAALFVREGSGRTMGDLMFRGHDVAAIFQAFFMTQVVTGLYALTSATGLVVRRKSFGIALCALRITIVLLVLTVLHLINDMLYMVPLGVFGAWLLIANRDFTFLPRYLRRLGTIAGLGLLLVGVFPILFGIFVDPKSLLGPLPRDYKDVDSVANIVAHIILLVGTLTGVITYPIWSILLGRKLLKEKAHSLD